MRSADDIIPFQITVNYSTYVPSVDSLFELVALSCTRPPGNANVRSWATLNKTIGYIISDLEYTQ
jgi:hypothetical protein